MTGATDIEAKVFWYLLPNLRLQYYLFSRGQLFAGDIRPEQIIISIFQEVQEFVREASLLEFKAWLTE